MTRTLKSLEMEIIQEDYDAAADSLANIAAWELSVNPNVEASPHTLEVASSYLLSVGLAVDGEADDWRDNFAERLITAGCDEQVAYTTADTMTSSFMLRKSLSLYNLTEDAPKFGLRVYKPNYRTVNLPRFIYSAIKLSN